MAIVRKKARDIKLNIDTFHRLNHMSDQDIDMQSMPMLNDEQLNQAVKFSDFLQQRHTLNSVLDDDVKTLLIEKLQNIQQREKINSILRLMLA